MPSKLGAFPIHILTDETIRATERIRFLQMDSQFFRSRWNAPSQCPHPRYYSPGVRPIPVVQNQTMYPPRTVPRSPKVVSIPVRFVEPEQDRSGSALKIQKVFRGFLVRKSISRVAALRREVEEIERRVSDLEAVELMRRDPRERLRMSEMLMNVLFRLDSVRGVDSGVRNYRKAVIRRAIALQDLIDKIAAAGSVVDSADDAGHAVEVEGQSDDRGSSAKNAPRVDDSGEGELTQSYLQAVREEGDSPGRLQGTESDVGRSSNADQKVADSAVEGGERGVQQLHSSGDECDQKITDEQSGREEVEKCIPGNGGRVEGYDEVKSYASENAENGAGGGSVPLTSECSGETKPESQTDSTSGPQSLFEEVEENVLARDDDAEEEGAEKADCDGKKEGEVKIRRNKELLEKMMEDNQKMMGLMAKLFERNERQTQLLGSLSRRVEQLERAFVCEKLRRKKKMKAGAPSAAPRPRRTRESAGRDEQESY